MRVFFLIVLVLTTSFVHAEVRLPDVIGSSMVLQQKQVVRSGESAEPGEAVTVTFGKIKKTVVADASGKWRVDLGKLSANSLPQTMTIAAKNTIVLKDILVGEVWLVAGQSNMQRLLRETDNGDAVQASANHPNIRLFNVSREVAFKHRSGEARRMGGVHSESVKEFSAAGYYFGVELEKELRFR
jgi:sialate O-acetylesterase